VSALWSELISYDLLGVDLLLIQLWN